MNYSQKKTTPYARTSNKSRSDWASSRYPGHMPSNYAASSSGSDGIYEPVPLKRKSSAGSAKSSKRGKRKRSLLPWLVTLALLGLVIYKLGVPDTLLPPQTPPNIAGLHPVIAAKQAELTRLAAKRGITMVVTGGFRSKEEQNRLYEQGRSTAGNIVTNAKGGQSYHNFGLAFDFAIKKPSGAIIWDMDYDGNGNGKSDWLEVASLAKGIGFTWGGDWSKFPDYPHLQMDFGYSLSKLRKGYYPADNATP